jgi:hypothetical protein
MTYEQRGTEPVTTITQRRSVARPQRPRWLWLLFICDAGLLIASGLIHLHFWDIAYRHVKTLDQLFLVQVAAALVLAVALLVTRHVLVVAASLLLMAGTIVGFLLVRSVGLFGFKLTFTSGLAATVLVIEIVAVVLLAATGWLIRRY